MGVLLPAPATEGYLLLLLCYVERQPAGAAVPAAVVAKMVLAAHGQHQQHLCLTVHAVLHLHSC